MALAQTQQKKLDRQNPYSSIHKLWFAVSLLDSMSELSKLQNAGLLHVHETNI